MSTKTITLSEDAYELLKARKEEYESFSDVVRRIAKPKSLLSIAGLLTKKEGDDLEKSIGEVRKRSRERMERLHHDS